MSDPKPTGLLDRLAARARLGPVGRLTDGMVRAHRGPAGGLLRLLFRPAIDGLERLPRDRPYLLVSTHSGGGAAEVCALLHVWATTFGTTRPMAGMTHPISFHVPGLGALLRRTGAIPSTYAHALRALAEGIPVLVFPGGDVDAFRPVWRAQHVDLGGRTGFLKLARRAWVPVVPMGVRGSAYALPMLWRSRYVLPYGLVAPRLLGLKRFPLSLGGLLGVGAIIAAVLPAHGPLLAGTLAWLWLVSPFAVLMPVLPATIRAEIGEPIAPEELFGTRDETGPLEGAYARVHGELERLLAER